MKRYEWAMAAIVVALVVVEAADVAILTGIRVQQETGASRP
jgi:hypothetical protein